jgi:hypothetical protein
MSYMREQIAAGADEAKLGAEFEAIAGELDGCLCRFLPEGLSGKFVDAVMRIRARVPRATTSGVFNALLQAGLAVMGTEEMARLLGEDEMVPAKPKRGARVVGVPGNKRVRSGVSIREA